MTTDRPALPDGARGGRLVGIDVARALALLGMMAAHVGGVADVPDPGDPTTWTAVVNGRSSTLFAVLAGVSVALVTGRTRPLPTGALGRARARLAVRAGVVVVVGVLLMATRVPVYVILPTYGALFLLAIPVLRWRRGGLLAAAAVCALVSVPAALGTADLFAGIDPSTPGGGFAVQLGVVYPVVTFLAYLLVGIAVGRSDLTARAVQWALVAWGTVAAVAGAVVGTLAAPLPDGVSSRAFPGVPYGGGAGTPGESLAQLFLSPRDHSSSVVDVVGTAGVAVAVIGCCLLVVDGVGGRPGVPARGRRSLRAVAFPLVAIGAMPLTVYTFHVLVIAAVDPPRQASTWWWFVAGSVVFALVWRRVVGRGPMERLVARVTALVPPPEAAVRR